MKPTPTTIVIKGEKDQIRILTWKFFSQCERIKNHETYIPIKNMDQQSIKTITNKVKINIIKSNNGYLTYTIEKAKPPIKYIK